MSGHLSSELLRSLVFPTYWNQDPLEWGSVCDWDIFFVKQLPGSTKFDAHNALGCELKILIEKLQIDSIAYNRAYFMKRALKNCDQNPENSNFWDEHIPNVVRSAMRNRIDLCNLEGSAFSTGAALATEKFWKNTVFEKNSPLLGPISRSQTSSMKRKLEEGLDSRPQNLKMKLLPIDSDSNGSESDYEHEGESESSDDEEVVCMGSVQYATFDDAVSRKDSEWKLKNGKLVAEVLASSTMKALESSKESAKKPDAYMNSVIRLGLSCIVDLSSEFPNGMYTWFGDEWTALKAKVYERVDMVPKPFECDVKEAIDQIDTMCRVYRYWEARDFLLDRMKDRSRTVIYQQIMKIYFTIIDMFLTNPCTFVNQDGQRKKLTEMEFVLKITAPILDIVFSDIKDLVELRWGETVTKIASACRKIDMRVVHQARETELSHTECAQSPTPSKIVRDRAKLLRTNKCILDRFLMEDISMEAETAVFGLQFSGLNGQFVGVDLFDDGLYFGLEGTTFSFPSQLSQITTLRRALEVLYFFKDNIKRKAIALPDPIIERDPYNRTFHGLDARMPKTKHSKSSFIKPTFFTPRGAHKKLDCKNKNEKALHQSL